MLIQMNRGHDHQAKRKRWAGGRHRYFIFNRTHFFQLIEGPEEKVQDIYQHICRDPSHYNLVELLCDYAPSRRLVRSGWNCFRLREHDREEVLQAVMDRGTSSAAPMMTGHCNFSVYFVEATEKANYFEIPPQIVGFFS